MINKLPDLIEEDIKYNIYAEPVTPLDFNLILIYPDRQLSIEEIKKVLKNEGII